MLKKILLVEDETDQIEVLKARLESSGFEFIFSLDGAQGIKKALEEKPDLILQTPQTRNIPIILLTAAGLEDIEDKSQACGADSAVRKPYDSLDLLAKIKALLK